MNVRPLDHTKEIIDRIEREEGKLDFSKTVSYQSGLLSGTCTRCGAIVYPNDQHECHSESAKCDPSCGCGKRRKIDKEIISIDPEMLRELDRLITKYDLQDDPAAK